MSKSGPKPDSALAVARHALAVAKQLQRKPERKYYQFSSQTTNYLTGISTQLFPMGQGVGQAQRIGDKVSAQRCLLRGKCYSLTPSNVTFRVTLVRSLGGGVPAVTDIWTSDDTQSQRNRALDDIYHVLRTETFTSNSFFLNGDNCIQLDWDLGLGSPIWYQVASTQYERGGLWLIVQADTADAASSITKPAIGDVGTIWRAELIYTDE